MKSILCVAALAAGAISVHAQAPDIAGDWLGTLKVGGAELHLVLHITKDLAATLDSVDQNANGIPIGPVTVTGSQVSFSSAAINAKYEGKLNADASVIEGNWTQGQSMPLAFKRGAKVAARKPGKPTDIDGDWLGTLDLGGAKLRLVLHITNMEDGLSATADSPDQSANSIPVSSITRAGDTLKFEIKVVNAGFEGAIAKDRLSIDGTFTQGGQKFPLLLKPVKGPVAAIDRKRPQNPVKPYPYREEEVAYRNEGAGIQLAATLTLPPGKGPFPAVVLITGSGPQDRDESLLGHKPFLVLADHLTRHGIAVLRADDRGTAKSQGDFAKATSADFATDAEAGLAYLKTRPEIDSRKLGLIGHSEGGLIAPMVAARNSSVAFIVMMAGTGVSGAEILPAQISAIAEASGESHEKALALGANNREILAMLKQGASDEALLKKMAEMAPTVSAEQQRAQLKPLQTPWFRYFLSYDPAEALRQVKCPVLAINGEKDMQVLPAQNLPVIRKALAGNTKAEVEQLAGLNHLFQTAKTGAPGEYSEIEETISPVALDRISGWIGKQLR